MPKSCEYEFFLFAKATIELNLSTYRVKLDVEPSDEPSDEIKLYSKCSAYNET